MLEAKVIKSRGLELVSIIHFPEVSIDNKTLIFFCHGFVGHKITPHRMLPKLTQQLTQLGYTVCRTDCIGSGDSEGNEDYMIIEDQIKDYLKVFEILEESYSWEKIILLGYSMGGTTATLLSNEIDPDGLVLWSPVSDPLWNFQHLLGSERFQAGMQGNYISIEGDEVSPKFFENIDQIHPLEIVKKLNIPIRVIHGSHDQDVLPINGWLYYHFAKDGKIHIVENAGHTYDDIILQEDLFAKTIEYLNEI
ncbi:alpha/beta hydrolase [Facklamia sp. P12934]|uniref:alpha/beta hydrolase n=1 Tax=unclassified Facklamia TaxID=2622293 RepID=UPI003D165EA7